MSIVDILTAVVLAGSIVGGGFRAMSKLTRLVDAVERLSSSMETVVGQIGDHERRITGLEAFKPRSRLRGGETRDVLPGG